VVTGSVSAPADQSVDPSLLPCETTAVTTTTVTVEPVTTTTALPPECSRDDQCASDDLCVVAERCVAGSCVAELARDLPAVLCRLDKISAELAHRPQVVRGKALTRQLTARLKKARSLVAAAIGPKVRARLKKARLQLAGFSKAVRKGAGKSIDRGFSQRARALADEALGYVQGVLAIRG
jgi:hypothetical protein